MSVFESTSGADRRPRQHLGVVSTPSVARKPAPSLIGILVFFALVSIVGLALVLVGFVLVGLPDATNRARVPAWERTTLERVAFELDQHGRELQAAIDSTEMQLRGATHVVGWMEGNVPGGSAQLIAEMSQMRRRSLVRGSVSSVDQLTYSGDIARIGDPVLRERLLELRSDLARTEDVGRSAVEAYALRLEAALPPAVWRYAFEIESEPTEIDFQATVRDLRQAGFDRDVRPAIRGLTEYREHLNDLNQGIENAIQAIDERLLVP